MRPCCCLGATQAQDMKPIDHLVPINEPPGFCKAPPYSPDCNRCYINVKLYQISID